MVNELEGYVTDSLSNSGTGMNYGIELSLRRFLDKGWYYFLNATLYESKYRAGDGQLRDTRFNGNYAFSGTGGKEFRWQKNEKEKSVGIDLRALYLGGFRAQRIDETASTTAGQTVFVESEGFPP